MPLFVLVILINIALLGLSICAGSGEFSFSLSDPNLLMIITEFRIPRTLALFSIGLSLGYCGVILQTLLDNPLSEPYTLGLSGAATLGAVIALFLSLNPLWLSVPLGAVSACAFVTFLILSYYNSEKNLDKKSLVLAGVMFSLFCGAFVTLLVALLEPSKMSMAIFWMMGQVGSPRDLWWPALLVSFIAALLFSTKNQIHLDRILLGDDSAKNLGTDVQKIRTVFISLVCLLTSLSVAIAGLVGFVGLVAPHITYRLTKSRRHKNTIIMSSLIGSALFLSADIFSRLISQDSEVPAGSLMAILGAPALVYLLLKGKKHARV